MIIETVEETTTTTRPGMTPALVFLAVLVAAAYITATVVKAQPPPPWQPMGHTSTAAISKWIDEDAGVALITHIIFDVSDGTDDISRIDDGDEAALILMIEVPQIVDGVEYGTLRIYCRPEIRRGIP